MIESSTTLSPGPTPNGDYPEKQTTRLPPAQPSYACGEPLDAGSSHKS